MQLSNVSFILALMGQERKKKKQLVSYLGAIVVLSMNFNQDRGRQGELADWCVATIENSAEINPIS